MAPIPQSADLSVSSMRAHEVGPSNGESGSMSALLKHAFGMTGQTCVKDKTKKRSLVAFRRTQSVTLQESYNEAQPSKNQVNSS